MNVPMKKEGRGRPLKVSSSEILTGIPDKKDRVTVDELAKAFGCSSVTVRSRLRTLRECGEKIIFDTGGLFILQEIQNEADEELYKNYLKWLINAIRGVAICGNTAKPILLESKDYIKTKLTDDERKKVKTTLKVIVGLLDYIDFEKEMGF